MSKEIWILTESDSSGFIPAVFELAAKALELAAVKSLAAAAVIVCKTFPADAAKTLSKAGISKIYLAENNTIEGFQDEICTEIIGNLVKEYQPEIILGAATVRGRSLMPRIAASLKTGLTADCTGLEIDIASGKLMQTRPAFGGNLIATIICETFPQMASVRPHVFKANPNPSYNGHKLEIITYKHITTVKPKTILSSDFRHGNRCSLADAKIIVSAGSGIGGAAGLKLVKDFAESIGAVLGASRAVIDRGWLDYSCQVGQTGITVHPEIYIACGISGAVQHLAGMQNSSFIISINKDPEAPVFATSDVGVTGDLFEILPLLMKKMAN